MIDQLPLYFLCYLMGWVPLYFVYEKLAAWLPFNLKKSSVVFSWVPFLYGLYMVAEIFRGYAIMHVVHQWMSFDNDLIIGTGLWFLGIGFPLLISIRYRTPLWLSILGVYLYLFPWHVWAIPVVLVLMVFFGASRVVAYGMIGGVFLMVGVVAGSNSLYLILYALMAVYLMIKSYLSTNSAMIR